MEEEPDSPLDAPQIGAGHVIRKVSNAARKVSDGVRKMSGEALKKMRSPRQTNVLTAYNRRRSKKRDQIKTTQVVF